MTDSAATAATAASSGATANSQLKGTDYGYSAGAHWASGYDSSALNPHRAAEGRSRYFRCRTHGIFQHYLTDAAFQVMCPTCGSAEVTSRL